MNITTSLTEKGQVTIPVVIRRLLNLKPFDMLVFTVDQEKIVATPVKKTIMDLYGSVTTKRKKKPDLKKLRQQMIKELAARAASEGLE